MSQTGSNALIAPQTRERTYYGWVVLGVAALAMVGTLPGRTQGLGLITEPLLRDLSLSPDLKEFFAADEDQGQLAAAFQQGY